MSSSPTPWLVILASSLLGSCSAPAVAVTGAVDRAAPHANPALAEVPLPAPADWDARLVFDNRGIGIWTVKPFQVFAQYASPEVVGVDDRGQCHVMVSYSGKWTPVTVIEEGEWLGGLAHGDVDPRVAGAELYTGGRRGNLYQVVAHPHGYLDFRLIAHLPGLEIHSIVAGELDGSVAGQELLVFTRPGNLYRLTPTGPDGRFETRHLQVLPGRVRDALVLPARAGSPREVATVTRAGQLQILTLTADGPRWRTVYQAPMGLGRIAMRVLDGALILYSTHDDGRILRHQQQAAGSFTTEIIYRGAQGPRGVAVGRFTAQPGAEDVAIFGYSGKVELLSRTPQGWQARTLFVDRDKGHWLAAAELDGRNDTDELVLSGYGGRIIMLARPPSSSPPRPGDPQR